MVPCADRLISADAPDATRCDDFRIRWAAHDGRVHCTGMNISTTPMLGTCTCPTKCWDSRRPRRRARRLTAPALPDRTAADALAEVGPDAHGSRSGDWPLGGVKLLLVWTALGLMAGHVM